MLLIVPKRPLADLTTMALAIVALLVEGFAVAALDGALVALLPAVLTAWGVGGSTVRAGAVVDLGAVVAARVLVLAGAGVRVAATAATVALRLLGGGAAVAQAVVTVNRIRGATWRNAANRVILALFIVFF